MHPSAQAQAHVDKIGGHLLRALDIWLEKHEDGRRNFYPFEFHLLRDSETINAFALPGGQVFITAALYSQLETDGQLAGVLGHEIGHVLSRHGAQRLAKQRLSQGLAGAAGVAGGDAQSAHLAQAIGQMVNMKYGREDELESDVGGQIDHARPLRSPFYDRRDESLRKSVRRGGAGPPEFMSTHPKPANRIQYINGVIADVFPNGVPPGLTP